MCAAIYYHPEAYTTSGQKLMGRNAAGESFLRGFFTHSQAAEFWAQVQLPEHGAHFAQVAHSFGRTEPIKIVGNTTLGALKQADTVYYPGPDIDKLAFQRAAFGHGAWSLCGITHTTSSAPAMDALAAILTAPVQPWDALICTSTAVKSNVESLLQGQVDYLKARLGITKLVLPQLPIIPLGIHTDDFYFTEEEKAAARKALGINELTQVVLFMGRLSFHAKAHPLAMYQALEISARAANVSVVLIECGWYANENISKAYFEAAQLACPGVRIVTLEGRNEMQRKAAWACADIFCSLADNIQETFGIVPIEAMAAGLPVVVSDWDGYKDTVRDGIDGFRIPTMMPQAGLGGDIALRYALEIDTYDRYCGYTSSLVAVDVLAAADAFAQLFQSPTLRREMGEMGRQRAKACYDWATIIPQYEGLWAQLSEIRMELHKESESKSLVYPWPARMDPFHTFAAYPTQILKEDTLLSLVDADVDIALQRTMTYRKLAMVEFAKEILPSEAELQLVIYEFASGPKLALNLISVISTVRQSYVFRSLVWLMKLGILGVINRGYKSLLK